MAHGRSARGTDLKALNEALSHHVRFALPCPALADCLAGYHGYEIRAAPGDRFEEVFFPAWANIRFVMSEGRWAMRYGERTIDPIPNAALFGPTSMAGIAEFGAGQMFGVGVTPLGWARLIGGDASRFVDQIVPLDTIFGSGVDTLASRLRTVSGDFEAAVDILEDFLLERLATARPVPPGVTRIMALLNSPEIGSVEEAAAAAGLPEWQLTRLCRRVFGFPPKRLMRRARFMRSMMALREPSARPWTERIEDSYHDQSHFIRDCHDFLGMSPSQFLARPQPIANTSFAERTRVLGAPAQALDRKAH